MTLPLPLPQILLFLKVRNILRVMVIVGFYGCIALGLAKWLWADQAVVHMPGYFVFMALLGAAAVAGGILLRIGRCPVCGHVFGVRSDNKSRNNFTSHCLNCGLLLDGSNASAYAAAVQRHNPGENP